MSARDVAAEIERDRLLAILRTSNEMLAREAGETLISASVTRLEVSLTTPGALRVIAALAADACVGAGTVCSVADAEAAAGAGARFLLSPHAVSALYSWSEEHDILYIPGALTPTEIAAALNAGARMVKLFPARAVGPEYVRDLRGPFPGVRLLPTGGIDAANARRYLTAGAVAVALGGTLVSDATAGDSTRLTALAREARAAVSPMTKNTEIT